MLTSEYFRRLPEMKSKLQGVLLLVLFLETFLDLDPKEGTVFLFAAQRAIWKEHDLIS
jgi:hypothetical protein